MRNKKLNCWEYNDCGRHPKGKNVEEFGVCPSSVSKHSNDINCGTNGGRICWTINNTFCKGEEQGLAEDRFGNCLDCDFYKYVRGEEGSKFRLVNINRKTTYSDKEITINVGPTFSHNTVTKFEMKFIQTIIENKNIKVILDFKETTKIDSSALGLLLVFREYLDVKGSSISLNNTSEYVRGVIKTANFHRLFKLGD